MAAYCWVYDSVTCDTDWQETGSAASPTLDLAYGTAFTFTFTTKRLEACNSVACTQRTTRQSPRQVLAHDTTRVNMLDDRVTVVSD